MGGVFAGLPATALSPLPKFTWLGLTSQNWGDSANWINGLVPNGTGAVVEFATKNPFPGGVNLGGGPFRMTELNIWNNAGMGWTFQYGTIIFASGGSIIVENRAGTEPILENGTFDLSGPVTLNVLAGGRFLHNPSGSITGPGSLTIQGAGETVFNGVNSYTGGTIIDGGLLQIGNGWVAGELTPGTTVNNGTLRFYRLDDISTGQSISGTGAVEKRGAGTLTFTGANSYSGTTTVQEGSLQLGTGGTTGSIGGGPISINGATSLILNRSNAVSMSNVITGAGTLNQIGSGATTLSGNSAAFTGTTNINAGSLLVTGALGGTVNINSGALLGGTGTVGSAGLTTTINNGGRLSPGLSPGTLTVAGNLSLAAGSTTTFELRTPGVAGGVGPTANDLVNVNGNLSIANGAILNVSASVSGSYRLFNVDGTITPGGGANLGFTTINTAGGAYVASVFQTAGTPNEVNLLLSSGGQFVQAFDGLDATGAVAGAQGGAGTWGGATTNWAQNPNGVLNDQWLGQVGVFGGVAGGAVSVGGSVSFQGLQFTANGYALSSGALNAMGNGAPGGNAKASFLNVDAGVTATIASGINSASGIGLDKLGRGSLILSGANSYSGLTDIQAGSIEVRNGAALGVGDGTAATGTRVQAEAALVIGQGTTVVNELLLLNGSGIDNGGALRSLSGANGWSGGITLESASRINSDAGVLTLGGLIGGSGHNLSIGGAGNVIIDGTIATGTGTITHDGAGTLTLNGANSFTGQVFNNSGLFANNGSLVGGVANSAFFNNAGIVGGRLVNSATASNLASGSIHQGVTNRASFLNFGTVNGGLLNMPGAPTQALDAAPLVALQTATFENSGTINGGLINMAKASNLVTGVINQGVTNGGTFDSKGAVHGGLTNEGLVQLSGQLNGAISNRQTGRFALTGALGGAMPSFENAGTLTMGSGDITGIGVFSNSGLLVASAGGARTFGASSFGNQETGLISQANGAPTDVLSITGDYVGAPGSRIMQDVNLSLPRSAAANGDRIVVSGSASGATSFIFAPTDAGRAAFAAPIPVFTTSGESTLAANEGRIGNLGQGFFDYFLRRDAKRNGFEIASFYNSTPAAGVAGSLSSMIASQQASFHQSFSSIVPRATDCRPNQAVGSPFIRMTASDSATGAAGAGDIAGGGLGFSNATKTSGVLRGFQSGFDIGLCNIANSGWTIRAGTMGGVSDITAASHARAATPVPGLEEASRTRATANVPFVGGYGFITNGAFTAEMDIRRDFYDIKLSSHDAATGFTFVNPHQKLKGDGVSFNGVLSYRIAMGEHFHLEPQIGLAKARTSFGLLPFATGAQDFMRIDPMASLTGRIGLEAGARLQVTDRLVAAPFVSASLWREFARAIRTRSTIGAAGQSFIAETERSGSFGQVGAGIQLSQGEMLAGYVRGDIRLGEKASGKALNAGLRLAF